MGKWADIAAQLKERDKQQVEEMNSYYGGGPTIENRLTLADARATDALAALVTILVFLDLQEQAKWPNA